ncbi:MAG: DUF882 domain-containing protein [Neisseria sp.]|nr:MAG: DUF882 domain-containing protein [Neisseria sp.]
MNRRQFLSTIIRTTPALALCSGAILFPDEALAVDNSDFWRRDRLIDIQRTDTGERRSIRFYAARQGYLQNGYLAARWLLRDVKDHNALTNIDIGLLNLLYGLQEWARIAGKSNPLLQINSAYRTRRRNATIEGAAQNSMHIYGRAVDLTVRGISLNQLANMAAHFNAGGIGIYSSFIHLDTGRVRNWRG